MKFDGRSEQAELAIGLQLVGAAGLIAFAKAVEGTTISVHWQAVLIVLLAKLGAVLMVIKGVVMWARDLKRRRHVRVWIDTTGGRQGARFLTDEELRAAGAHLGIGALRGKTLSGMPIFDLKTIDRTHALGLGPNGRGKSTRAGMPWLISLADEIKRGKPMSICLNDAKDGEYYIQIAVLLERMGLRVWLADPMNKFPKAPQRHRITLNPFDEIIRTYRDYRDVLGIIIRDVCKTIVKMPPGDARNLYFYEEPQKRIELVIRALLDTKPDLLSPGAVHRVLADPVLFGNMLAAAKLSKDNVLRSMAETVQSHRAAKQEHEPAHISKAVAALAAFEEGSLLHLWGQKPGPNDPQLVTHADLFKAPTVLFMVGRQDISSSIQLYYALHFNAMFTSQTRLKQRWITQYIIDEANNCVIPSLPKQMTLLRQKGARISALGQSQAAMAEAYGKDGVAIIESETNVKHYFGCADYDQAKRLADAMGRKVQITPNIGGRSGGDEINGGLSVIESPLMTTTELSSFSPDFQLIHYVGLGWVFCRTVAQNNIGPYAEELAGNPDYGGRLTPDITVDLEAIRGRS